MSHIGPKKLLKVACLAARSPSNLHVNLYAGLSPEGELVTHNLKKHSLSRATHEVHITQVCCSLWFLLYFLKTIEFYFWKYSLDPQPKVLQFEKQNPKPRPNNSFQNQEAVQNGMYILHCVSTSTTIPHSSNLGITIYHPELDQINCKRQLINCKKVLLTFISMLFRYTCGHTHFRKNWGFHNFNHLGLLIKSLRS